MRINDRKAIGMGSDFCCSRDVAVMDIAALVVYSRVKADREYMRDPYEGMLIGRVSSGMDRKGRQTRKIIR
jgi:hypothetical protein